MTPRAVWIVSADEDLKQVLEPLLGSRHVAVKASDPTSFLTAVAEGAIAEFAIVEDPPRGLARSVFESRLADLSPDTRCIFISGVAVEDEAGEQATLTSDDVVLNVTEVVALVDRFIAQQESAAAAEHGQIVVDAVKASLISCIEKYSELLERYEFLNGHNGPRVRRFTTEMAKELALPAHEVDAIAIASLLYDVGMVPIPPSIKLKATALSEEELDTIHGHAAFSAEFADGLNLPWDVREIILHHHEAYDGAGYPAGLRGEDIPVGARVLAVADAYFAMISRRPNRESRSEEAALGELRQHAGQQFDPKIVELFISLIQATFLGDDAMEVDRHPRIVLVDDDRDLRALLDIKFSALGYQVVMVVDAAQALKRVVAARPQAVLVNADVTWIDAFQLLHRLRQEQALSAVPVLLLSSRDSSPAARVRALEATADDYLVRPIDLKAIVGRVISAMRRRRRLTEEEFVRQRPKEGIQGKLSEMALEEICQLLGHGQRTACVSIANDSTEGQIFFEEGRVRHAIFQGATGQDAFFEMLRVKDGDFVISHGVTPNERSMDQRAEYLLMEGLRLIDESSREEEPGAELYGVSTTPDPSGS